MATWVVNSYSYPNPFQDSAAARGAWEMFQSFLGGDGYRALKEHWESHSTRPVSAHTVESWKAAFEEFGLLYVLTGSDEVVITPGGRQLIEAAEAQVEREFAWVGLNLLLRYPLRGETGRRSPGPEFEASDLLLYWFVFASLLELDGFWQQELFRVLSHVFQRAEAPEAIGVVKQLRSGGASIDSYPDPSGGKTGGVYNALNQVMVHGSLSHMLFTSDRQDSPYLPEVRENWWHPMTEYRDLIHLALGDPVSTANQCAPPMPLLERMPAPPPFADEEAYFSYAGAEVPPLSLAESQASSAAPSVHYEGEVVWLLTGGEHYKRLDESTLEGPIGALCVLGPGQRVVLSDDLDYTYIVDGKALEGAAVRVDIHRARPILDQAYVVALFEEMRDA